MKRSIVVGAVAFLLGAASVPRAANENETLALLCKRFEATAGHRLSMALRFLRWDEKTGRVLDRDDGPDSPEEDTPKGRAKARMANLRDRQIPENRAVALVLWELRDMVCAE